MEMVQAKGQHPLGAVRLFCFDKYFTIIELVITAQCYRHKSMR